MIVPGPPKRKNGVTNWRCMQCKGGLDPGTVKTFDPRCGGCQEKKVLGLRTGNEPRPSVRPNRPPWFGGIGQRRAAKGAA
jgi:hypothetical protein